MMNSKNHLNRINRREFAKQTAIAGAVVALSGPSPASQVGTAGPLCIFSKNLQWLDYDQAAETAAALGFTGLDLTVRKNGHVLPENVERDLPRAVAAAHKAGLMVALITTEIDAAENPLHQRVLETAVGLGIGCYRMGWLEYDHSWSIRDNLKRFHVRLAALAELNEKIGILGAYQNHSGANLGSPVWDIAGLLHDIHSPWLGCQYDIRHAMVEGANAWPLGLELVAPYINSLDLKDFLWLEKDHRWQAVSVPIGQGMVGFREFFIRLKKLNVKKDIPLCIHYEYDLGGAEKGSRRITASPEAVVEAMKKDVDAIKAILGSL